MVDRSSAGGERSTAQTLALLIGATFVLVGILGFVPGITTNAPGDFSGQDSDAELLAIFQVSVLHSLVHVLFGLAGLALARRSDTAQTYLLGGGIIYVGLWVLGLVGGADWIPANDADNWLHLALAVVLLGAWYVSRGENGLARRT
jgi:hypothetical protein